MYERLVIAVWMHLFTLGFLGAGLWSSEGFGLGGKLPAGTAWGDGGNGYC